MNSVLKTVRSLQKLKKEKQDRRLERERTRRAANPPPPPPLRDYWQDRYGPQDYLWAKHIALMVHELENLEPGEALILCVPPRHSKSDTVGAFIESYLGNNPEHEVMYTSFTSGLAYDRSRKIRNAVADPNGAFQKHFPHVQLSKDRRNVSEWRLAEWYETAPDGQRKRRGGGGLIAAGVGGTVTGKGADLLVCDDLLKGRKEAESETVREGTLTFLREDLLTRTYAHSRLVIINTRWHAEDPVGWTLKQLAKGDDTLKRFKWKIVCLPALALPPEAELAPGYPIGPDPLGREEGEPLWKERFGKQFLEDTWAMMGDYGFYSIFQQTPIVKGGAVFRSGVLRYLFADLEGARIVITLDTAASKKKTADNSAFVVQALKGKKAQKKSDVLEVVCGKYDLLELLAIAKELQQRYGVKIRVERTGQSIPIIKYFKTHGIKVIEVKPVGDKFTRAQPAAAAWNSGRIRVPAPVEDGKGGFAELPWVMPFINEVCAFTGTDRDDKDDQVDGLAYGWNETAEGGVSGSVH